jgi:hypothetical protein
LVPSNAPSFYLLDHRDLKASRTALFGEAAILL